MHHTFISKETREKWKEEKLCYDRRTNRPTFIIRTYSNICECLDEEGTFLKSVLSWFIMFIDCIGQHISFISSWLMFNYDLLQTVNAVLKQGGWHHSMLIYNPILLKEKRMGMWRFYKGIRPMNEVSTKLFCVFVYYFHVLCCQYRSFCFITI